MNTQAKKSDADTISELKEANKALASANALYAQTSNNLAADKPNDKVLDQRRPEDMLTEDDVDKNGDGFTLKKKWAGILKDGGMQLYSVMIKPWVTRAKCDHGFLMHGLTAAEIYYYHRMYDDAETEVATGTTKAIHEVIQINGQVCAVSQAELREALRETKSFGTHVYDQPMIDRLYPTAGDIPLTVEALAKIMPVAKKARGVYGIDVYKKVDRELIDERHKLHDGSFLTLSRYTDYDTRTSGAGVLWRKTGIAGG